MTAQTELTNHEIAESDGLIRRLPRKPSFISNGNITSAVFKITKKDTDNALSVDLERLITDINTTFNVNTHALVKVIAGVPMSLGCECKHTPTLDNHAHSSIYNITRAIARQLAARAIPYTDLNLSNDLIT